jgi:hypothetical protein
MKFCLRPVWQFPVIIFLLTGIVSISAAADWPPITPEEQEFKDIAGQPGESAAILERQEVADDLNNFHSTYKRIKVLNEAGRKYADVELPYDRQGFSISEISGRTVHPDGTVIPFESRLRQEQDPRQMPEPQLMAYSVDRQTVRSLFCEFRRFAQASFPQ